MIFYLLILYEMLYQRPRLFKEALLEVYIKVPAEVPVLPTGLPAEEHMEAEGENSNKIIFYNKKEDV